MIVAGEIPAVHLTDRSAHMERRTGPDSTLSNAGTEIVTIRLGQEPSPWLTAALDRISLLTALNDDWNSYGSRSVTGHAVSEAVRFLMRVAFRGIAEPAIVPLADGGLQVEWHRGAVDVEVAFGDDEPGLLVVDQESGEVVERPLTDAVSEVRRLFERLRET